MNQQKSAFIFIGPPGSGKGTLSKICVTKLGWSQLSTGDLCREHIAKQTEIGKQIDFAIKSGKLVTDKLIVEMVHGRLENCFVISECVILDGFPRTIAQAEALDVLLHDKFSFSKLNIVRLRIEDEQVVIRLIGRYICKNNECQAVYSLVEGSSLAPQSFMTCDLCSNVLIRRSDDTEGSIRERLRIYHQHEKKLLEFYENSGETITDLDVDKNCNLVFEDFTTLIGLDSA